MITLLFLLLDLAVGCHPECRYQSDDPVCFADCQPACAAPVCAVQCIDEDSVCAHRVPSCRVLCPTDQCESDTCPECETICDPLPAQCVGCSPLCEETECAWQCTTPADCTTPTYELQCEQAACPLEGSNITVYVAPPAPRNAAFYIMILLPIGLAFAAALGVGTVVSIGWGKQRKQ